MTATSPQHNTVVDGSGWYSFDIFSSDATVQAECPCGWRGELRTVRLGDFGAQAVLFAVGEAAGHRAQYHSEGAFPAWTYDDAACLRDALFRGVSQRITSPSEIRRPTPAKKPWWKR